MKGIELTQWQAYFRLSTVPLAVLLVLVLLIIPLPPSVLDICFTLNIASGLIIFLAALRCKQPLELVVFPSIVLFATLFRLALNVASTRVVLLNGHKGADAAGHVIQAFAEVVISNNYTVGIIIFVILVIVNFIVITKGANRVSEVSARFTLDALPGKQLAIDAELNAGLLSPAQAQQKRAELTAATDFYGAMDGASKFVRGDAIAGILILLVNIIGGVVIGTLQHAMPLGDAVQRYFLLTVGDGLVAQLPALLVSTATALIVTRSSVPQELGQAMYQQILKKPQNLLITAVVIGVLALFPGMPHLVFLSLASALMLLAYFLQAEPSELLDVASDENSEQLSSRLTWRDVGVVHSIEMHLGYRLLTAVQSDPSYQQHLQAVRRQLSEHYGFLIPEVRIHDDLQLAPQQYRFTIHGQRIAEGEAWPNCELAIWDEAADISQAQTVDPINGLPARWVKSRFSDPDVTYIDSSLLLASHLKAQLRQHLAALFDYEALAGYLAQAEYNYPELIDVFSKQHMSQRELLSVLQSLLGEQVSIAASQLILSTVIAAYEAPFDVLKLSSHVRKALGHHIVQSIAADKQPLQVMRLDKNLEQNLLDTIGVADLGQLNIVVPEQVDKVVTRFVREYQSGLGAQCILVDDRLRHHIVQRLRVIGSWLPVLATAELAEDLHIMTSFVLTTNDLME
jgi:flagellar biosynthesis protein FlhA